MSLKMLIESDPHQTRIAVLEDDRLTEIFVERHRHRGLVGNVYKGRVTRVLPGMQAAFVDVGLERDAFLYVSDVAADVESMEDLELDDGRADDLNNHNHHAAQVSPSIDDLLKAGQEIIVQVVKDPLPTRGRASAPMSPCPGATWCCCPPCATSACRGASRTRSNGSGSSRSSSNSRSPAAG